MSIDMFPDAAIEYLLEHADEPIYDWMDQAIAHHSNKVHDDFYDMIGENLYHLHSVYYPNCGEALEYYVPEGERPVGEEVVCAYYPPPVNLSYITPWSQETGQLLAEAERADNIDVIYYLDTAHDMTQRAEDRVSGAVGEQSGTGVETQFVVDGVRQWRPLEVLEEA